LRLGKEVKAGERKLCKSALNIDMKAKGLSKEMTLDRLVWSKSIIGKTSNFCKHGKRMLNDDDV